MNEDLSGTFWEHASELRTTVIKCLAVILICIAGCFYFHQEILQVIISPLNHKSLFSTGNSFHQEEIRKVRITNSGSVEKLYSLAPGQAKPVFISSKVQLIIPYQYQIPPGEFIELEQVNPIDRLAVLGPLEGMIPIFKLCFWAGLVVSSPVWIYLLLTFIRPALNSAENTLIWPLMCLSFIFMMIGACFGFYVVMPLAIEYFMNFNNTIGFNLWTLSHYLNFTLYLAIASALFFEISVILFILVHYQWILPDMMTAKRRHVIVIAFILGAILTPPDIISQCALAVPFIGLYELAIVYSKLRGNCKTRKGDLLNLF
jgi:sec-independent protein translocase protein TatC